MPYLKEFEVLLKTVISDAYSKTYRQLIGPILRAFNRATRLPDLRCGKWFVGQALGLIQNVLTILVFWSCALPLPWLPPSSRSLRFFAWASILLHRPLDICLDLLPAAPLPPVQKIKWDARHTSFYNTCGHTPRNWRSHCMCQCL